MRNPLLLTALALALPACSPPQPQIDPQPQAEIQHAEPTALVRSRGEVVAITREYNAITIRHEPIPEYGMGAMTMEFTVDEAAKLEGVDVGDQVAFELSGPLDIATIRTNE